MLTPTLSESLFFLYLLLIVALVLNVILARRAPVTTLAWIFSIVALPFVGAIAYFFLGPRRVRRRRRKRQAARAHMGTSYGIKVHSELDTITELPAKWQGLARQVLCYNDTPPILGQGLSIFHEGDAMASALIADLDAARSHIHLEYYIFNPDDWGRTVLAALTRAAQRGVTVRLLCDGMGSSYLGAKTLAPLIQAGGEICWFNPLLTRSFGFKLINFRTHRKIVVVDGRIGFIGGMNITHEHIPKFCAPLPAWRDTHVRMEGALVVARLDQVFIEDWQLAHPEPYFIPPTPISDFTAEPMGPKVWTQFVDSGPDSRVQEIEAALFTMISMAQQEIHLTTPYFVPTESLATALFCARARGVAISILAPIRGDSKLVTAATETFLEDMIRAGIQVYRYLPSMLHAKVLVVDREVSLIGTANFDSRSLRLNFEIVTILYNSEVGQALVAQFEKDLTVSRADAITRRALFVRIWQAGARLFSPLL